MKSYTYCHFRTLGSRLLVGLFILLVFSSCLEKESGCLEPSARNFDAAADKNCCCEYPELVFRCAFKAGENPFSLNNLYTDAADSVFYFEKVKIYLSDFELITKNNESVTVADSIFITTQSNELIAVTDDFILLTPDIFRYEIGNLLILKDDSIAQVRFKVGIASTVNHAAIDQMPTGHALAKQSDSLHTGTQNEGYIFTKLWVVSDTAAGTTNVFSVTGDAATVQIQLDYPLKIQRNQDLTVKLNLDVLELIKGVSFAADDEAAILAKVVANTKSAFSVGE